MYWCGASRRRGQKREPIACRLHLYTRDTSTRLSARVCVHHGGNKLRSTQSVHLYPALEGVVARHVFPGHGLAGHGGRRPSGVAAARLEPLQNRVALVAAVGAGCHRRAINDHTGTSYHRKKRQDMCTCTLLWGWNPPSSLCPRLGRLASGSGGWRSVSRADGEKPIMGEETSVRMCRASVPQAKGDRREQAGSTQVATVDSRASTEE